jgi:hypothetical protein
MPSWKWKGSANTTRHRECDYPVIQGLEHQFDQLLQQDLGCAQGELMPFNGGCNGKDSSYDDLVVQTTSWVTRPPNMCKLDLFY